MNPYEVEHNIKPTSQSARPRRRPSMSSFFNQLSQIETSTSTTDPSWHHNNPHAVPTPVDVAASYRLLQDQFLTLRTNDPSSSTASLLDILINSITSQIDDPPTTISGCSQAYLDTIDRVPRSSLKPDETCPICGEKFLDDQYCLVVVLPCHPAHKFDLECVGPWLRLNGTCPLDRKKVGDGEDRAKEAEMERERMRRGVEEFGFRQEGEEAERRREEERRKTEVEEESDGDDGMYA
ncbi:8e9065bc-52d4-4531-9b59-1e4c1b7e1d2b [Sclerotinia trifoliorum]|uniref:8e9065bc-52d4-4531-9b59-1e4c1b7e1d2b n=1 Tax=Sclerotinia trifoliorum TaxID=28548 RepID=A0A8H2VY57_9HELO|nr:8e9065bc-52d4-4531-9b59-1e4c1b7e1d2b [Sclerotinia trifoliorum]